MAPSPPPQWDDIMDGDISVYVPASREGDAGQAAG
jgi:hypothetical protein